jgi:hypothetical protein
VIGRLPNTLLLHLNRLVFNYDTFMREKINTRVEFPEELAMHQYTKEGQPPIVPAAPAGPSSSAAPSAAGPPSPGSQPSSDKPKPAEEPASSKYRLVGVLCHTGTAEYGHYYSYIRDRSTDQWFEFNDSVVRPFNFKDEVERQCFGGEQVR